MACVIQIDVSCVSVRMNTIDSDEAKIRGGRRGRDGKFRSEHVLFVSISGGRESRFYFWGMDGAQTNSFHMVNYQTLRKSK